MGSFFENILKGNIAGKILSGSKNGIDLGDILGGLGKGKAAKEKEPDVPVETGNSEMSLENVTSDSLDDALEKIGNEQSETTPSSGGGLGDILGKMGMGADKQSGSGGGLGDILGKMGMGGGSSKSSGGLLGAIMSIIALAMGSVGNKAKTKK